MARTISILIPTHNRCRILARTLESLSGLQVPRQIEPELVIVANACSDDTQAVVAEHAAGLPMPVRCVAEAEVGVNPARNRAAMEARGDVLAFLDDDVWVEPGWLAGLCEVYDSQPADVVGGRVLLWWEAVSPPSWMSRDFETLLSGLDLGENMFEIGSRGRLKMIGANFSFTRATWEKVGRFRHGLDRTSKSLLCGGETEFLQRARAAGCRSFYAPRACVKHWVNPSHIEPKHLHRLAFGFGRTSVFLAEPMAPWRWWPTVLGQPLRALVSFAGEPVARLQGNESAALLRRLGGIQRCGLAMGALEVIFGRAPVAPAA